MNEMLRTKPAADAAAEALNQQVDAMSLRLNGDRDQRCAKVRGDASRQALLILRAARKDARTQVHAAVVLERKLAAQAARQAHATAWLEQQRLTHEQTWETLREMWSAINAALDSRWADPACRSSWIQAAGQQARQFLLDPRWRITHGAGLSAQELEQLRTLRPSGDGAGPEARAGGVDLVLDPAIRTGIKISVAGACLDATTGGLLSSRSQVEAEFLALMLTAPAS